VNIALLHKPVNSLPKKVAKAVFVLLLSALLCHAEYEPVTTSVEAEGKREKLYLHARLGDARNAEPLLEEVLQTHPADKQTLLALCALYLDQKDAPKLRKISLKYLSFYPKDEDGLYYYAVSFSMAGQFQPALKILKKLREKNPKGRLYPYLNDLGYTAKSAGDWRTAISAYREILGTRDFSSKLKDDARKALDEIYRTRLPKLETKSSVSLYHDDWAWRNQIQYDFPLTDFDRLEVALFRDELYLSDNATNSTQTDDRNEGRIAWTHTFTEAWETRAWLGGEENDPLGGVEVTHSFDPQKQVALEISLNERCTDGLSLELLNGRQHRITPKFNATISKDYLLAWDGTVRQVYAMGESIGEGFGSNFAFDRILIHNPIELLLGYRGSFAQYSNTSENGLMLRDIVKDTEEANLPADPGGLVSRELNHHGAQLSLKAKPLSHWEYRFTAHSYYAEDQGSIVYNFATGASYAFSKSSELSLDVGYANNPSNSNTGSDLREMSLAFKCFF